jgi:hypothetical protein
MGLDRASFCCYLDNKAQRFMSCHGIITVMGLEKVRLFDAWSCHEITKFFFLFLRAIYLYNKVHLIIARSCHGIIIVVGLGKCFFLLLFG